MSEQIANQDTFAYDLLNRVADIQRTIQVTRPNGKVVKLKFAKPRWWEPVGNDSFPGFFNKAVRTQSTPNGRPIRTDTYQVTMRLVVGPAFAGYKGEYEDAGNILYDAVLNAFDKQQRLAVPGDPLLNSPLQFVQSARILNPDGGIQARQYDDNPKTSYLCIDYPLDVVALFQNYRQS